MDKQPALRIDEQGAQILDEASLIPLRAQRPDPGIDLNIQALSLQEPEILHIQAEQQDQEKGKDAEFNILIRLAATGGPIRVISLQTLQQSMARAWRENYYDISQLSRYIFVAHFRSLDAAMSVFTRQPWSMGSDNLLLEWMDPEDLEKDIKDHKFDTVLVTIRVYGIPMKFRSQLLLQNILQTVGSVSEFHPFNQAMISGRQEYMWGTVKIKIASSVRDKVWMDFGKDMADWVYLFYERIGRICTFCGVMFHTVQYCTARNSLLMARERLRISLDQVSPNRFGQWMTNLDLIPAQSSQQAQRDLDSFSTFSNPQLARLQRQTMENHKGKSKMIAEDANMVDNPKELSLRKINKEIQRLNTGSSSVYPEDQLNLNLRPSAAHQNQVIAHGQSGAELYSVRAGVLSSVELNAGGMQERCNNAGGKLVRELNEPVQHRDVLSQLGQPGQSGDANQAGRLSHLLLELPYTPGEELNVLRRQFGPDLSSQATQQQNLPLGQDSTSVQAANPPPQLNIPSLHTDSATHITQSATSPVIPASMEDKNLRGQHISSAATAFPLSTSPLRSTPERPPDSLFPLPLPPAKRASTHGDRGTEGNLPGAGVLGAAPNFVAQASGSEGVLGAPPAEQMLHLPSASVGDMGAAVGTVGAASHSAPASSAANCNQRAQVPGSSVVSGSRGRSGNSRWDVPPSEGVRGKRPNFFGVHASRPRATTWRRNCIPDKMGFGNAMCRGRSKSLEGMNYNTSIGQSGQSLGMAREDAAGYEPWHLRSPSPSLSAASVSSRQGAISPPGIDRLHHLNLDTHRRRSGSRAQVAMESQDDLTSTRQGDTVDLREGQLDEEMEFGDESGRGTGDSASWAAAHGPNAPWAP